jgi:hypothetical protein
MDAWNYRANLADLAAALPDRPSACANQQIARR